MFSGFTAYRISGLVPLLSKRKASIRAFYGIWDLKTKTLFHTGKQAVLHV